MQPEQPFTVEPFDPTRAGRSLTLLEFLDWTLSFGGGLGAAYFLFYHDDQVGAGALLVATLITCALDIHNKARILRRGQRYSAGTVLTGTVITLGFCGGAAALFYHDKTEYAFFTLALFVVLTGAETRLQIRRDRDAAAGGSARS